MLMYFYSSVDRRGETVLKNKASCHCGLGKIVLIRGKGVTEYGFKDVIFRIEVSRCGVVKGVVKMWCRSGVEGKLRVWCGGRTQV